MQHLTFDLHPVLAPFESFLIYHCAKTSQNIGFLRYFLTGMNAKWHNPLGGQFVQFIHIKTAYVIHLSVQQYHFEEFTLNTQL